MYGRIYVICLLVGLLMLNSCGKGEISFVDNTDTPIVNIDGIEYVPKEKAKLIDDNDRFVVNLTSVNESSMIDLVIYFKDRIKTIGSESFTPSIVCYVQNDKYFQMSATKGEVSISTVDGSMYELSFENVEFGNNGCISGKFSACVIKEDNSSPITINIWGNEHPFKQWINKGSQQWIGTTLLNIQNTELLIYPSKKKSSPSPAIIICPGGAYSCLSAVHEGSMVAEWFANHGVTAAVLHYCLPNGHPEIPLSDIQEAMRHLRKGFSTYQIRPDQVGVIGFSAGGHLASLLSTHFDIDEKISVLKPDAANKTRPDFTILCYPVITMELPYTHASTKENLLGINPSEELINICSSEKQITSKTPPALLFHSVDDYTVSIANSNMYYQNLIERGIRSRLVKFSSGGHGWGFDENFQFGDELKETILKWMTVENIIQ